VGRLIWLSSETGGHADSDGQSYAKLQRRRKGQQRYGGRGEDRPARRRVGELGDRLTDEVERHHELQVKPCRQARAYRCADADGGEPADPEQNRRNSERAPGVG
jgi:hypothetical protein